ncbi:efflux RND transporter periplasmic adaptor subunit [Jutongia hominis]|uniref:HlyD family efflux transporter periplasmic adaptor subunit n=1 Tax=Jutongia hominis TaxID=2763664 RepID=A0ABR7MTP0_9FIRM|nr:HlyD family efflux transporter periplasmic adaptor subunit [Jutongia hominis]MBC8557176.1 HlyD family efflux transporter periplasmic adaptor subunit [Jutongia hominis]
MSLISKIKGKKKITIGIVCLLILSIVAGFGYYQVQKGKKSDAKVVTKETEVKSGNLTVGITESGNVAIDTLTQSYSLSRTSVSSTSTSSSGSTSSATTTKSGSSDSTKSADNASLEQSSSTKNSASSIQSTADSSTQSTADSSTQSTAYSSTQNSSASSEEELVVKKVCVSTGQNVKKGDTLLTLTKSSVESAKKSYQENYDAARIAYNEAKTTRDAAKVSAEYEYKQRIATGKSALATYKATVASLEANVSSTKAAYQKAQNGIKTLPTQIASLKKKIAKAKSASGVMDSVNNTTQQSSSNTTTGTNTTSSTQSSSTITQLTQELTQLQTQLSEYRSNLNSLKSQYTSAKKALKTGKITAKQTYEESRIEAKNAKALYTVALSSVNDDVDAAKETYDQTKEELEAFNAFTKNNEVTAKYTGKLTSVGYSKGDSLNSSTAIAAYVDTDGVNITVSVAQDDVSNIKVGDNVNIYLSAYEDELFEGTVTSISSSSTGDTTVSYPVVVTLSGDVSKVYDGMSSEVTFVSKEVKDVTYVSNKAITTEGTKSYVTLKKADGTTKKTKVVTGFSDGHNVEIKSGLKKGDTVLIESQVSQ